MTAGEILNRVDMLDPNSFDAKIKLGWLNALDRKVFDSLIMTHRHEEGLSFEAVEDVDRELLIPEPYGMDCYVSYLRAKIAGENLEAVRYNQHMVMFNAAWQDFANAYNRTHMPIGPKENRLKF